MSHAHQFQSPAVEAYRRRKAEESLKASNLRAPCSRCRKPSLTCYCPSISPVATNPRFVILMHPLESKHPVGTGRMAHLCLKNSSLYVGADFESHEAVNSLLQDPKLFPLLLFPGPRSLNLSCLSSEERRSQLPPDREPVIIVLDGTWHLAKKMLHRSPNLQKLPRVSFVPSRLSEFRVRKQPHPQCFSTIEAIHELLELYEAHPRESQEERKSHDVLLEVFRGMVERQLSFRTKGGPTRHSASYHARKARRAVNRAAIQQKR